MYILTNHPKSLYEIELHPSPHPSASKIGYFKSEPDGYPGNSRKIRSWFGDAEFKSQAEIDVPDQGFHREWYPSVSFSYNRHFALSVNGALPTSLAEAPSTLTLPHSLAKPRVSSSGSAIP